MKENLLLKKEKIKIKNPNDRIKLISRKNIYNIYRLII